MPAPDLRRGRSPRVPRLTLPGIALLILAAAVAIPSFGAPTPPAAGLKEAGVREAGVREAGVSETEAARPRPEQATLGSTGPVLSGETYSPARSLAFLAGTHTGYQFNATGAVTASKTALLGRSSSASTNQRAVIVGRDGTWFYVVNGIWGGYWLRESASLYLPGVVGQTNFSPVRTVNFSAGTHTGYQFSATGAVTASRAAWLSRASSASASGRAVINGRPYLLITNGIWAGYWIVESPVAYVTGTTAVPQPAPTSPGATPTPAPTPAPTATPAPSPTAAPPATARHYIFVSPAELARRPMSGAAWTTLKSQADKPVLPPNLADQDQMNNVYVLAKALVYARTGIDSYRQEVLANLRAAVGTEAGGRTLALGRELAAYVIAADLIDLARYDPAFDSGTFRPWLRSLLTKPMADGRSLRQTHEERPNNWGTHAGASRIAVAAYLNDGAELARSAAVFRGWLGDRASYAGFKYGDLWWQPNPAVPVGIAPTGSTIQGHNVDGALPEEMRRGGPFQWPPVFTDYAWEGLQGAVLQAELLQRAGYDAWSWQDRALLRAAAFLYRIGWAADGDDMWQPWLIDYRYGTRYRVSAPHKVGKNFGWTEWVYGP